MVILKASFKKIMALLLMLTMVLSVIPCVASAAEGNTDNSVIDFAKKGSITVTKYATVKQADATESTPAKKGDATGTNSDAVTDTNYKPLNGAKFVLFKIADADKVKEYYNGTNNTPYTLDAGRFVYTNETTATYDGSPAVSMGTGTTSGEGANAGECSFTDLPVGIYVLKEITAPDQITTPLAEDSLISIPMVNTATSSNNGNAKWIYDVYVYPKNHESTGTVELTKVDQNGSLLDGVMFQLSKKELNSDGTLPAGNWDPVTGTSVDGDATSTPLTLTTVNGKIKLANLPANLYGTQYKLEEVSAPNGYIVNKYPIYFKVNTNNTITWNTEPTGECANLNKDVTGYEDANTEGHSDTLLEITLCNEQTSLTKKVFGNGTDFRAATNLSSNWKENEQYRLDDTITYSLIAYVPNNITEITYEIKDLPDLGIDDSIIWADDYAVTYADTAAALTDGAPDTSLTFGTHYNLSAYNETGKGQGFKLTLTDATAAGKFIQIVYKAHMNANAVIAGIGNGNTATLTYSKYINGSDDKYTITDEARVYTYQYRITKYKDSVAEGNKLGTDEAVDFQLLDADKNRMKVVKLSDGVYRLAITGDTLPTDPYTMTTKDGAILIQGLENDTYYLKETKTLNGYNLLSGPFEITVGVYEVTSWASDTGYTETTRTVKDYQSTAYYTDAAHTAEFADNTATANSNVINKKGFVLPQTGGMGYLLFCTVGVVLIAGGTMLIFGGRRKKIR